MVNPGTPEAERARRLDALALHGNVTDAAIALGMKRETLQSFANQHRASLRIDALQGRSTPGFEPVKLTTVTDDDGNTVRSFLQEKPDKGETLADAIPGSFIAKLTKHEHRGELVDVWTQYRPEAAAQAEAIKAAIAAMCEAIPPAAPVLLQSTCIAALCNLYTMTDCHMGMLAWHREGGADWDIKIAERVLTGCFEQMVAQSAPARVGIVSIQGDWNHSDGLTAVTPTSGHVLDQDGRFSKMVGASIRTIRALVTLALGKHEQVIVVIAEGNHDPASAVWLRLMFATLYENEPRVQVIDSELPYYAYQHGKIMLCWHHGHLKKNDALPLLFAAQFPKMWGDTVKRYAHSGHRHHAEVKEHSGMTVTQHPTLAARDAYAARGGWLSERQATAITYHSEHGQVASVTVCPEMLEAA